MKHTWKAALAVAAVAMIGTAGAARADLTLDGQTSDLFSNPTAQVARQGVADLQANYQHDSVTNGHFDEYGIGGAYGIAENLELSGNYEHTKVSAGPGSTSANDWRLGGKYQVFSQREKGFALAVGGNYDRLSISGNGADINHWNAFVAGTKSFNDSESRAPIQGTLGLRYDHFSSTGGPNSSSSKASVYAGAAVPLSSDGTIKAVGEVGSKIANGLSTPYTIGLRYHPKASQFNVGVGFGRPSFLNQLQGSGTTIFAQVGYTFGK